MSEAQIAAWMEELDSYKRRLPYLAMLWVSGFKVAHIAKTEAKRYRELRVPKDKLSRDLLEHWEHQRDPEPWVRVELGLRDDFEPSPSLNAFFVRHCLSL